MAKNNHYINKLTEDIIALTYLEKQIFYR